MTSHAITRMDDDARTHYHALMASVRAHNHADAALVRHRADTLDYDYSWFAGPVDEVDSFIGEQLRASDTTLLMRLRTHDGTRSPLFGFLREVQHGDPVSWRCGDEALTGRAELPGGPAYPQPGDRLPIRGDRSGTVRALPVWRLVFGHGGGFPGEIPTDDEVRAASDRFEACLRAERAKRRYDWDLAKASIEAEGALNALRMRKASLGYLPGEILLQLRKGDRFLAGYGTERAEYAFERSMLNTEYGECRIFYFVPIGGGRVVDRQEQELWRDLQNGKWTFVGHREGGA